MILVIFEYALCVIFVIVGLAAAIHRIDDWKDPNHRVGNKYKKTWND